MSHTILLVEDNVHIMNINRNTLLDAGYQVVTAVNLRSASEQLDTSRIHLIVLDIMLPDGDGVAFCLELRADGVEIPVLFLTAKGDRDDILEGLRAGGDDYLTKPYDLEIFLARVRALLRRAVPVAERAVMAMIGGIKLDLVSGRAFYKDEDLLLTPKEFSLLHQLWQSREEYISAADLYKKVWGMDASGGVATVKERIFHLRRKLGVDSGVRIESIRGKGYCLKIN